MLNRIEHFRRQCWRGALCMLLIVVGLLLPAISTPALADSPVITGTATAGSLNVLVPSTYSFGGTVGGTALFNMLFSASDLTGSGNGWNLTITSTPFATSGNTHILPTTASTITGVTATCTTAGSCSNPTLSSYNVTTPVAIPAAVTAPTAVKFFNTNSSTGMGVYTLTPAVSVAIPTGALIGSYTSTFTITISSGP
jgi:hypothetical protein